MRIRTIHIKFLLLIIFLSLASIKSLSSQLERKIKQQKYIKKGDIWYVEEKRKLYQILPDVISVKFKAEVRKEEIEQYTNVHQFKIKNVNRLGVYDLEFAKDRDIFRILHELKQSRFVEFAELNTIGEYIFDDTPATEMIIQDKRFVRKDKKWYLESKDRLYEVIPNSLSCKFKKETTPEERKEFLNTYGLKVIRKNRLGIYDLEIPSEKNAVELFADLHGHQLFEFVEVNTIGVYEKE